MKSLLISLVLLCCCLVNSLHAIAQKKYNILFIAVDDMSTAFDAYGNPDAKCPNYARLMQHGMMFRQTYVQYPLCSPSRTSLFSGKRPDSTGITNNGTPIRSYLGEDYKFLPEYFDEYGYYTLRYGKVGPCGHENEMTWDYDFHAKLGNDEGYKDEPDWWIDTTHKTIDDTRGGVYADSVSEIIKNPGITPYFCAIGLGTHNPFTPMLDYFNRTGDSLHKELLQVNSDGTLTNVIGNGSGNILLPDTPPDDTLDIPAVARKGALNYTPYETQQRRHAYYGEMMQLDDQLGKLLDALDSAHAWDNTIVVFWSDHGLQMGEHQGQWLKMTLFEEVLRIPFVICAPGGKVGICNRPVESVDIFPTLTELCGLPKAPLMEGSSLVPLLENPTAPWKTAGFAQRVFSQGSDSMGRAVRTTKYHYNSWLGLGEELYDIVNDPKEYTNLAGNPDYKDVLDSMRSILARGWKGALPPAYAKHSFYKDNDGDGYGKSKDSIFTYFAPDGYAEKSGDCNDQNPNINPGAKESPCNGKDDNCDGAIDESNPEPKVTVLGDLDICSTGSVELQTKANANFTYQWKRNGGNISGATTRKYTAITPGNYKVKVTYENCSSLSEGTKVTNSCDRAASGDEAAGKLSIYPNPSNGIVTVTYSSILPGKAELKVYNKIGNLLFSKKEDAKAGVNIYQLNLSNLKSDMYNLEITNGDKKNSVIFIIQN